MKRRKLISVLLAATMMAAMFADAGVMRHRQTQRKTQTVQTARKPVG